MNKLDFYVVILTLAGVSVFAVFCFTVVHFSSGWLEIQGPGGINVEARLGENKQKQ